jgi:hypothetical protein
MSKNSVSKSPERYTFQKNGYIERCRKEGKEPDPSIIKMYESWAEENSQYEHRPENDLEYDLRTTEWILEKARTRDEYAQNIYAAMCNMRWQRLDVFPILKDEYWSCSWRSAGGVVADMLGQGDYIDWYCSGIGNHEAGFGLDHYEPTPDPDGRDYVPEGVVTEEIRKDFQTLGWVPSEWPDDD